MYPGFYNYYYSDYYYYFILSGFDQSSAIPEIKIPGSIILDETTRWYQQIMPSGKIGFNPEYMPIVPFPSLDRIYIDPELNRGFFDIYKEGRYIAPIRIQEYRPIEIPRIEPIVIPDASWKKNP